MSDVDIGQLASQIDAELAGLGTPERARQEKAYLKSDLIHYGVGVPAVRRVAKSVVALDHPDLISLVSALWDSPVYERRQVTVELLTVGRAQLVPTDMDLLERFLRESRTWALVDHLAEHVVGELVVLIEQLGSVLDRWARDSVFWIRRSAFLALLGPLRSGGGDFDRFSRYADSMLEEKEFFIRKAIGWVLRDTAKRRPDLVYEWILPRAARASGVTIREVVKPLSEQQRERVLAAR